MRESRQPGSLKFQGAIQKGLQPSARTAFDYKPQGMRSPNHARWFISGLVLPLLGGIVAYAVATHDDSLATSRQPAVSLASLPPIEIENVTIPAAMPPSLLGDTVEYVVRRNDTMD